MKKLIVFLFVVLAVSGCVKQQHNTEFFGPQDRIESKNIDFSFYGIEFGESAPEHGESMRPMIDVGSKVLLMEYEKARELKSLNVGDIIVYKNQNDKNRAHRIVDISFDKVGMYYTTKGDNNWWKDSERIRENHIEYVVVGVLY